MRWSSYVDLSHNDVYGGVPAMVGGVDDDLQQFNVTGFAERSLRGFVDSTHTASSTTSASVELRLLIPATDDMNSILCSQEEIKSLTIS